MWTYLLRRLFLMIPTLFGVTVVSFCIMQLAPGDPLLTQAGPGGNSTESAREGYLILKRDLKLDKPLVLNFLSFRNLNDKLWPAIHFLGMTREQIETELPRIAAASPGDGSELALLRNFIDTQGNNDLRKQLQNPEQYALLAKTVREISKVPCENLGRYGVPKVLEWLDDPKLSREDRMGCIHALNYMVVEPFRYTYSRNPQESETAAIATTWKLWWEQNQKKFPPLDPDRRTALEKQFSGLVKETAYDKILDQIADLDQSDMPFFLDKLLAEGTSLPERNLCALALKLKISRPLQLDVPQNVSDADLARVSGNWQVHAALNKDEYHPSLGPRLWNIVADTQYAHMVWRLATFNFGRSAVGTRDPVSGKIWDAVIVTAPLMLLAEIVIYVVSVPLGVICAVYRGKKPDQFISLGLFLLYSIPPFVAGMLFLLYFSYGRYWKIFPMEGLHDVRFIHFWEERTADAGLAGHSFGDYWSYLIDYLWHATQPVICLSLFSLAGLAMYGRSSMLDVLGQDYIRTARAKGLSEGKVIFKHALRNSMMPIITLFASFLPALLGGSVLIEVLFGIPGMGRLSWSSITQRDFPTLMALTYLEAIVVLFSVLASDLLYVLIDRRISFSGREAG